MGNYIAMSTRTYSTRPTCHYQNRYRNLVMSLPLCGSVVTTMW